jgi:hypothetical protein
VTEVFTDDGTLRGRILAGEVTCSPDDKWSAYIPGIGEAFRHEENAGQRFGTANPKQDFWGVYKDFLVLNDRGPQYRSSDGVMPLAEGLFDPGLVPREVTLELFDHMNSSIYDTMKFSLTRNYYGGQEIAAKPCDGLRFGEGSGALLDEAFVAEGKSLPSEYEEAPYQAFLEKFGTHIRQATRNGEFYFDLQTQNEAYGVPRQEKSWEFGGFAGQATHYRVRNDNIAADSMVDLDYCQRMVDPGSPSAGYMTENILVRSRMPRVSEIFRCENTGQHCVEPPCDTICGSAPVSIPGAASSFWSVSALVDRRIPRWASEELGGAFPPLFGDRTWSDACTAHCGVAWSVELDDHGRWLEGSTIAANLDRAIDARLRVDDINKAWSSEPTFVPDKWPEGTELLPTPSPTTAPTTAPPPSPEDAGPNVAVVVGAIAGSVAGVAAIAGAFIYARRRPRDTETEGSGYIIMKV